MVWIQFSRFLLVSGNIPSGRAVMVMPADAVADTIHPWSGWDPHHCTGLVAVAEAVVMPWLTWSPTD